MAAAQGVCIHHIARETADVKRLAKFYQEVPSDSPLCVFLFFGNKQKIFRAFNLIVHILLRF